MDDLQRVLNEEVPAQIEAALDEADVRMRRASALAGMAPAVADRLAARSVMKSHPLHGAGPLGARPKPESAGVDPEVVRGVVADLEHHLEGADVPAAAWGALARLEDLATGGRTPTPTGRGNTGEEANPSVRAVPGDGVAVRRVRDAQETGDLVDRAVEVGDAYLLRPRHVQRSPAASPIDSGGAHMPDDYERVMRAQRGVTRPSEVRHGPDKSLPR